MGRLIDGTWTSADGKLTSPKGDFVRQAAKLRNWITVDGSAGPSGVGGFPAESGRYHLYVSEAMGASHTDLSQAEGPGKSYRGVGCSPRHVRRRLDICHR